MGELIERRKNIRGSSGKEGKEGKEQKNRINSQITAPKVRVINNNGEQLGVISIREALGMAESAELDLVEIQPNADPPVVRVMDYGKYLFKQNKQRAEAQRKNKRSTLKELKFRPTTDQNDYEIKLRNIKKFLESGDKVKITVWFKGREMTHQEFGMKLLDRIKEDLAEEAKVEFFPKLEGKQLTMVLAPKKR